MSFLRVCLGPQFLAPASKPSVERNSTNRARGVTTFCPALVNRQILGSVSQNRVVLGAWWVFSFLLGLDFEKAERNICVDSSSLQWILWDRQILGSESLTSFRWASPAPCFLTDLRLAELTHGISSLAQRFFFLFRDLKVRGKEECSILSVGNKLLLLRTCC